MILLELLMVIFAGPTVIAFAVLCHFWFSRK